MKRKIVKQGAATLMISLPSKWCKKFNLEKGKEVDIEEANENLIVSVKKIKGKEKVFIDVSGWHPLINRILASYYIKGVDELEIKFSNPSEIKDFQKRVLNELLGFEIIKQGQNSLIIKEITGAEAKDIDDIIKRIFLVLDSMAQELIDSIEKKQNLEPVIEIDVSINKFVNFCLRVLNKKGYTDFSKTPQIYGIIMTLEQIGDLFKEMAKQAQGKLKITKEEIETLRALRKLLDLFGKLMFEFSKDDAVSFAKEYQRIRNKIDNKTFLGPYLYELSDAIIRMNNNLLVISF